MTDEQKLDRQVALDAAKKVIRNRVGLLQDTINKMEHNINRMTKDDDSSGLYFDWALNDLQNMLSNLGLSELARASANVNHHDNVLRASKS